ncbi:hypothetical protein HYH02_008240 [Chlamydomonas schloesseri]|uniref:Uncharacterized protein n=1 Tax=Chlamydomonas schloesseri TaxID=2026947 RepID=A0A835WGN8_9CHLO|nr:hypothetical protein HYH02_008240 [Chlamydomonas schloesseri]|eukprot:KAG2446670.1 hypothetical protein HYH02_008240 [Chlamydomonas schloesseri]
MRSSITCRHVAQQRALRASSKSYSARSFRPLRLPVVRAVAYARDDKAYTERYNTMASNLSGVVRRAVLAAVEDISKQHEEQQEAAAAITFREVGGISGIAWAATAKVANRSAGSTGASTPAAAMSHDDAEHVEDLTAATPAAMAAVFLRRLEDQLHELHYSSGVDDAGEVLGGLHGAALLHHPNGSLRAVVDKVAAACTQAEDAAGPATVRLLRSLSAAVGRMATMPNAEMASEKAAAVVTCLTGMCEAFEGAKKKTTTATTSPASSMGSVDFWEEYATQHQQAASNSKQTGKGAAPVTASVPMEAAALLREAAAVLDCIASNKCDITPHPAGSNGHVALSAPHVAHPLLSLLETRLYAADTWEPQSPADIACSLVELVATALSPAHAGNTLAPGGVGARNMAAGTLRGMVSAQHALVAALRGHEADPAAAGRLLAALAEALGAAAIARDTFNPTRGPRSMTMFGEAQLLAGLSRMCTGEAMKHMGQSRPDNEPTMVLEVLAEQARDVAEQHRRSITQVLQDLHAVPKSLGELSKLPGEALVQHQAAAAAAAARAARRAASTASSSATETLNLLRRTAAGLGHAASSAAAASVSADGKSGVGSNLADAMKPKKEETKKKSSKA